MQFFHLAVSAAIAMGGSEGTFPLGELAPTALAVPDAVLAPALEPTRGMIEALEEERKPL